MDSTKPDGASRFRGRFDIKKTLGRGAMGEVHLAHDVLLRRDVAIKIARIALLDDPEIGERARRLWLNETGLATKLRHPCIVEIYESGATDDLLYLVMEYVNGVTLKRFTLLDQLLPIGTVIDIVHKVCSALKYAHSLGILHRDIKPDNVMMAESGQIKLTDFAACYHSGADEAQVSEVGTFPYVPPEHFERGSPTVQSDIYAVGIMTYQLLTGALPFTAKSIAGMLHEKSNGNFVALELRRKDIPRRVRLAVHRAMHHDPKIRYASWQNFCDDLIRDCRA